MKRILAIVALGLPLLLLIACSSPPSGGNGNGGGGNGEDSELNQETASEYSDMAVMASEFQMAMLLEPPDFEFSRFTTTSGERVPGPIANLMSRSGITPQQTDDCVTVSGNTTDADGDSVPVNATYTYACSESNPDFDFVMSIYGTVSMADKDDSDPDGGYTLDMTDFEYEFGDSSGTMTLGFDLDFDLTVAGTTYDALFDFTFTGNGPDGSFTITFDFDQTYVADSASDPFAAGTLTFSGNLGLVSDGESFSLTASSDPSLSVDRSCSTGYSSGAASYSDDYGNDVAVSFSCDSSTATYNGTPL